jgi:hypothetical protein
MDVYSWPAETWIRLPLRFTFPESVASDRGGLPRIAVPYRFLAATVAATTAAPTAIASPAATRAAAICPTAATVGAVGHQRQRLRCRRQGPFLLATAQRGKDNEGVVATKGSTVVSIIATGTPASLSQIETLVNLLL